MSTVHQNYNITFFNKVINGKVRKRCELLGAPVSPLATNLSTYLIYVQYADDIIESILPEVENVLNGLPFEDVSVESIDVLLGMPNTEIEWYGRKGIISTIDFQKILQEYADFLQTPPLNGTKI